MVSMLLVTKKTKIFDAVIMILSFLPVRDYYLTNKGERDSQYTLYKTNDNFNTLQIIKICFEAVIFSISNNDYMLYPTHFEIMN